MQAKDDNQSMENEEIGRRTIEAGRETLRSERSKPPSERSEPPSLSSSVSSSKVSRTSRGTLLNSSLYVDENLSRAIISEETSASKQHVDSGSSGPYRQALVNSDIQQLRRACGLRGLQHQGHGRKYIIGQRITENGL